MYNVAIVGIGNISSAHINGLLEFPDRVKIVALCDIYPEKAEAAKEKYGLKDAVVFDDHQKMLASDVPIGVQFGMELRSMSFIRMPSMALRPPLLT